MPAPILRQIVRQHAEMAAFLWTVYNHSLLRPNENPEMDEMRLARLLERLEAHLDGLRVAGEEGRKVANERFKDFPEPGELFVVRMLSAPDVRKVAELDLVQVRKYLATTLNSSSP